MLHNNKMEALQMRLKLVRTAINLLVELMPFDSEWCNRMNVLLDREEQILEKIKECE